MGLQNHPQKKHTATNQNNMSRRKTPFPCKGIRCGINLLQNVMKIAVQMACNF